jgi:hypothetical protein
MVWFPKAAPEENPTLEIGLRRAPRGKHPVRACIARKMGKKPTKTGVLGN